jgi:hypothetical protein
MTIRNIAEVGSRLEKAVRAVSDEGLSPQEMYDLYEQAAIQILDSEFDDYSESKLEKYLMDYLERKRGKFGLNL